MVSPTINEQVPAFRALYKLLESKVLRIPQAAPYLEGELRQCERRITESGHLQFGHPVGSRKIHDDTVYALVWATTAARKRPSSSFTITTVDTGTLTQEESDRILEEGKRVAAETVRSMIAGRGAYFPQDFR